MFIIFRGFFDCTYLDNSITWKRICPKLNSQDVICTIGIHTLALQQKAAYQAIMVFNAALFPGRNIQGVENTTAASSDRSWLRIFGAGFS